MTGGQGPSTVGKFGGGSDAVRKQSVQSKFKFAGRKEKDNMQDNSSVVIVVNVCCGNLLVNMWWADTLLCVI